MFFRLFSATAVGENPSDCVCTKCCRAWKKVAICVCEKFLFVMTQKRETATRCIRCEFKQFYCREPSPSSAGCSLCEDRKKASVHDEVAYMLVYVGIFFSVTAAGYRRDPVLSLIPCLVHINMAARDTHRV